jgi:peroxiredoxin
MIRTPSKQSVFGICIFAIAILALLCEFAVTLQHAPKPPVADGMTAPQFQLNSLAREEVSLEQFRGRAVVVMFWSGLRWPGRWFRKLERVSEEFPIDQAAVLMVSVFRDSKYLAIWPEVSLPVLYDEGAETTRTYHAYNRPVIYLIDKEGKVYRSWVRDSRELEEELKESISEVLKPEMEPNESNLSQEQ